MFVQLLVLFVLCVFYISYLVKMLLLKRQGITGNLLGKGQKPIKAIRIEVILKSITYVGAAVQYASAMFPDLIWSPEVPLALQIIGIAFTIAGVTFFLLSITVMRTNWRAGYDERQNTALVSNGVYRISRNPAFVGFDLLYAGCSFAFPNALMIAVALVAMAAVAEF